MTPVKPAVLLVNPKITMARHARFPLSLLALAAALEEEFPTSLLDGNIERDTIAATLRLLETRPHRAVGVSVMGGPQLQPAIDLSRAIRARHPSLPIIWGGYFPTLYPDAALNNDYVDYLVRGEGEQELRRLLAALPAAAPHELAAIPGIELAAMEARRTTTPKAGSPMRARARPLPYDKLGDPRRYLARHVSSARAPPRTRRRSAAASAARSAASPRCSAARTALPAAERLDARARATSSTGSARIRSSTTTTTSSIAKQTWCRCSRSWRDTSCRGGVTRAPMRLVNLSADSWSLVRRSRLRMAYIGAETPNDAMLKHDPQGHARRPDSRSRGAVPRAGRDSGAVVHGGAAARTRKAKPSALSNSSARSSK